VSKEIGAKLMLSFEMF